ncbi:virulence RhuM family protein [Psychrobacter sp. JCM 18900]|uniref:virulence RhuM family protein n=1 Tax=Psychrobacter sp. JCM 18900 TaxID=1298608 RepID=UPI00043330B7|nr:RhuM family protein [Psychrobacter sp. JCM 18900]GAF54015.1 putative DNA-binding protein in cluster with type I restriction-modification system [Psychrobacter sp. JCM 18900]
MAKVEIYESADGKAQVDVRFEQETVWLSQAQMTVLFGHDQSVISRHIANAIKDEEIDEFAICKKMHIANSDRPVTFYDLDVVISVGYRIKSPQGVQFRRWSTQRLREYLVQGHTLNQQRFDKNSIKLQQALNLIKKTAQSPELKTDEACH